MLYVGVDLAERHSATVVLTEDFDVALETHIDTGKAEKQEHPWERFQKYRIWSREFILHVGAMAPVESMFVIEEPYPHAVNVAPSYRMQGAIIAELMDAGIVQYQVRITKSKPWQDYFGYTKKEFGNAKAWAKLMCEGFDYSPGDTLDTKTLAKPKEDLRDAYLLARWLKETSMEEKPNG